MNDDQIRALTAQSHIDQRVSEVNETASVAALFYKVLIGAGIAEASAARMTETFSTMILMRHFGAENHGGYMNFFLGEPDDGEGA